MINKLSQMEENTRNTQKHVVSKSYNNKDISDMVPLKQTKEESTNTCTTFTAPTAKNITSK